MLKSIDQISQNYLFKHILNRFTKTLTETNLFNKHNNTLTLMKSIRNIAAVALIAVSFAACTGNNGQKTIGGSVDTSNAVEGSNAGNETTGSGMTNDTTANRNGKGDGSGGQTTKDSTSNTEGNAKPDGRPQQ